jgi:hypothetical protein
MAIIYSYPPISDLSGSDTLLVNDTSKDNSTKTASIDDIKSYVNSFASDSKITQVTLTPVQLGDLDGGGEIELVPAQGANKVISLVNVTVFLDYTTEVYNFNLSLEIKSGSLTQNVEIPTSILNSATDIYSRLDTDTGGGTTDLLPNTSLKLVASPSLTVNTGESPLTISLLYRVIDFS